MSAVADGDDTAAKASKPKPSSGFSEHSRPIFSKQWQTERPRPTATYTGRPGRGLNRHGTNLSKLNEAIWSTPRDDTESTTSSSSSSSSSDEDEPPGPPKSRRLRRNRGQGAGHGKNPYSRFNVGNDEFKTRGHVSKRDGRLNISVNETNNRGYLAKAVGAAFLNHQGLKSAGQVNGLSLQSSGTTEGNISRASSTSTATEDVSRPRLTIVVMVIGSRGDIQPFLKLGKILKDYGHRVRIATHPAFKEFVEKDSGLEFFSVGGDPAELMAFMVKNPGMIPKLETVRKGEIGRRRDQMAEMFEGFWRACINATDDEKDINNLKMMGEKSPFIADAIIANPPSFAHIHCAESLGIPLHLMFTFPYTPTQAFPHPLANIKKTNVDPGYTNFMSYPLVEMMTWQGLGDLVNNFRVKTLGLEPVSTLWAPGQLYRLKVPYTYLWSPSLVPKPGDWGPEIDIAGFVFLDLASSFEPPEELVEFLEAGDAPVYIGFGSIVVDDPDQFTKMIFEAVKKAGVRALVSKGWGGLGDDNVPENIFMLENTPHDWLFPRVKAVVHHGGAGTTAIGLKCGKPTMIVPFFGDQQFWGSMIGEAGAGAKPVPYKSLTADKLAEGIKQCLSDEARKAAENIAADIEAEGDGAKNAVESFHRSLTLRGQNSMRCSILEDGVAVWCLKNTNLRLSALAAELLVAKKRIHWKQLRLIRHYEWNDFEGPGEPLTGGATAIMGTVAGVASGIGSVPFRIAKRSKKRAKQQEDKTGGPQNTSNGRSNQDTRGKGAISGAKPAEEQVGPKNAKPEGKDNDTQPARPTDNRDATGEKDSSARKSSAGLSAATTSAVKGKHTVTGEPLFQSKEGVPGTKAESASGVEDRTATEGEDSIAEEVGKDIGSGLGKTAEAIAKAPMDLSLAVAQGFHNAPRLYGDTTVRRPTRITGYKSGLKAAGEEFVYGIYDGVTGLVKQPYIGAHEHGVPGFVKGVGMGLTGFVLKDLAALFGPFGYTLKGLHKELTRSKQPTHFIRKARIAQGQREYRALSAEEKKRSAEAVDHGWTVVQQVWNLMNQQRAHGLKGRVNVLRERKSWKANGAFENVQMAEKALKARKNGEGFDVVFAKQRESLAQAKQPRPNVGKELEANDRKANEEREVRETRRSAARISTA